MIIPQHNGCKEWPRNCCWALDGYTLFLSIFLVPLVPFQNHLNPMCWKLNLLFIWAKPLPLDASLPGQMSPLTGVKIRSIEVSLCSSQFPSIQSITEFYRSSLPPTYTGPPSLFPSLGHHHCPPKLPASWDFFPFLLLRLSMSVLREASKTHTSPPCFSKTSNACSLPYRKKKAPLRGL